MRCESLNENNEQCRAKALKTDTNCFAHSENIEIAERRHNARVEGGTNSKIGKRDVEEVELKSLDDVTSLLCTTIHEVRSGEIAVNRANSIGYLLNVMLKAFEQRELAEMQQKIEVIEDAIKERTTKESSEDTA